MSLFPKRSNAVRNKGIDQNGYRIDDHIEGNRLASTTEVSVKSRLSDAFLLLAVSLRPFAVFALKVGRGVE